MQQMTKRVTDEDDINSVKDNKESNTAKKLENSSEDNLVKNLRSDMLLTSSVSPKEETFFQKINLKYVFGILLSLFIIIFAWFMLGGPGRPILENGLALLIHTDATPTQSFVSSIGQPTATRTQASATPLPSLTQRPTNTAILKPSATTTRLPSTTTPTPEPSCRDALSITLADVGKTLCTQGTIQQTVEQPNAFMVIFSTKPGSFYWVTYDMVWSKAELNACYQTTGTIVQLGNRPILKFNYSNIPELCP
jgi:hypothetical protein